MTIPFGGLANEHVLSMLLLKTEKENKIYQIQSESTDMFLYFSSKILSWLEFSIFNDICLSGTKQMTF